MSGPTAEDADRIEKQPMPAPEGEDVDGALSPGEVNPTKPSEHTHDIVDPADIDDDHPHDEH